VSANTATIFLDQRTTQVNSADILAYPQLGSTTGTAANPGAIVVAGGTGPSPEAVRVGFPSTASGNSIQFLGDSACTGAGSGAGNGAFTSVLTTEFSACDSASIDQVVTPTSTAAIAKAVRVNAAKIKKMKHHKAARHTRHVRRSHKRA
jgi:hypothetical protein